MDGFDVIHYLSVHALTIALAATRVAIAFLILPIFSKELVPSLVRNAIFIALALITVILHPAIDLTLLAASDWVILIAKEATIGIGIGVFFGIYLWAFETAGQIIDNQIGAANAQVHDPLSGNQTTLIGSFLGRLANYIFITTGGLMLLSGVLMESYSIWPIEKRFPDLALVGVKLFESEFSYYLQLTLLIAAPMLLVTLLIDSMMGLINRYAQQFNVFFLSISLKMLAAISMLFITMMSLIQLLISELHNHAAKLPQLLQGLYGG